MSRKRKALIGIVSKPVKYAHETVFRFDELVDNIRYLLVRNGALAIGILPPMATLDFHEDDFLDSTVLSDEELADFKLLVDACDGIILQGGLNSLSYEAAIAKYAIEKKMPILGICAGFNNLIRAFGGDVRFNASGSHNKHGKEPVHQVTIIKESKLFEILLTERIAVNSMHTMIAEPRDIKGWQPVAYSEDGLVEAIELATDQFALGLKWHPEVMVDDDPRMEKIFRAFLAACQSQI